MILLTGDSWESIFLAFDIGGSANLARTLLIEERGWLGAVKSSVRTDNSRAAPFGI